jgi:hypothetical protein
MFSRARLSFKISPLSHFSPLDPKTFSTAFVAASEESTKVRSRSKSTALAYFESWTSANSPSFVLFVRSERARSIRALQIIEQTLTYRRNIIYRIGIGKKNLVNLTLLGARSIHFEQMYHN